MVSDKAFVFLLHSPVPETHQLDRLEQSLLSLHRKLDTLINALGEELEAQAMALDGESAGQERDSTQSLG